MSGIFFYFRESMSVEKQIQHWIKAAQAGETAAWNILYQQYYPAAYATALQACRNIADAKDVVQDSFITAWLKISQLQKADAFGDWLKKILLRNCYQLREKKKQTKNVGLNVIENESWFDKQLENLDSHSTQGRLYSALTLLPETLRTAMLLRYFSSFQSYNQIAEILAVPIGTVRSRLNEGKSKLAEKWNEPMYMIPSILRERNEWNSFYKETYTGMHQHDEYKDRFINHLEKNIQVALPGGKSNIGPGVFENMVIDDRRAGSWLKPTHVMSCGNISVIEVKHFNSVEYPMHCPPVSVTILSRDKARVNKMNLYISLQ
jgi:RNA polymerase sigma factor (sigma-70 family)